MTSHVSASGLTLAHRAAPLGMIPRIAAPNRRPVSRAVSVDGNETPRAVNVSAAHVSHVQKPGSPGFASL